jgi:hypothetical protein
MTLEPQGPVSAGTGRAGGTSDSQKGADAKANPNPDADATQRPQDGQDGRADKTDKGTSDKSKAPDKSGDDSGSEVDLSSIPDELKPHVEAAVKSIEKTLKANYTRKTQELAKSRHKVEAYDAFEQNPVDTMKRMAENYGFQLTPRGGGQANQQQQPQNQELRDWQPQTWDEVFDKFAQRFGSQFEEKFMGNLKPVFDNIQSLTTKNIETQLSEIDPDWKLYEDDMIYNLKAHPTLAKDVGKLYRMSIPDEVLESRATQKALKKYEDKARSAKVEGKSSVRSSSSAPSKVATFDDAVKEAKRQLGM